MPASYEMMETCRWARCRVDSQYDVLIEDTDIQEPNASQNEKACYRYQPQTGSRFRKGGVRTQGCDGSHPEMTVLTSSIRVELSKSAFSAPSLIRGYGISSGTG